MIYNDLSTKQGIAEQVTTVLGGSADDPTGDASAGSKPDVE